MTGKKESIERKDRDTERGPCIADTLGISPTLGERISNVVDQMRFWMRPARAGTRPAA